jgi:glycosyltransferase involved in cell wall biosynthesis
MNDETSTDAPERSVVLIANPGADLYGSDRMLLETVTALRAERHRVVVTVPGPGPLVAEVRARGADVRFCPTPVIRKSLLSLRGVAVLGREVVQAVGPSLRLLRDEDPDAVVVNTITPPLWLLLSRLTGRSTICHVHEGEASASRMLRVGINLPLLLADRLIINSEFSLSVLRSALPVLQSKAIVIYNCVTGPPRAAPAREQLSAPCRLVYVGRLSPRKGPQVAIAAVAELRERGVAVTLELVGSVFPGYEWFERELRELVIARGLEDSVFFRGFHPLPWPWTQGADIVLVPSTVDEPFGNTAVEAVLSARPLVVSSVGGLPEAVSGLSSAVLVAPADPHAVAKAVEAVMAEWPMWREAATRDSVTAAEKFSAARYGEQLLTVLADVLMRPRARRWGTRRSPKAPLPPAPRWSRSRL